MASAPPPFVVLRRATPSRESVAERVRHWQEFYHPLSESVLREQGARCMDCGVPFCQGDGGGGARFAT